MNIVWQIVIGALCLGGALLVLLSALAMQRERDAFSRINVLSPATGLGLPMIVTAGYLHGVLTRGFTAVGLIKLVITVIALLIVSSVATNVLARAAYLSGAPVAAETDPQDLARDPKAGEHPPRSHDA